MKFNVNAIEQILKSLPGTDVRITGDGRKILAAMAQASKGPYVAVGITQDKFSLEKEVDEGEKKSNYTLGEIGVVHEFGSKDGRIPERSYLRVPYMANFREMLAFIRSMHKLMMSGRMSVNVALGRVGVKFESIVRDRIRSNIAPALKPATLRHKTRDGKVGDVALIDIGQLIGSISSQVVLDGDH